MSTIFPHQSGDVPSVCLHLHMAVFKFCDSIHQGSLQYMSACHSIANPIGAGHWSRNLFIPVILGEEVYNLEIIKHNIYSLSVVPELFSNSPPSNQVI